MNGPHTPGETTFYEDDSNEPVRHVDLNRPRRRSTPPPAPAPSTTTSPARQTVFFFIDEFALDCAVQLSRENTVRPEYGTDTLFFFTGRPILAPQREYVFRLYEDGRTRVAQRVRTQTVAAALASIKARVFRPGARAARVWVELWEEMWEPEPPRRVARSSAILMGRGR